MNFRILGALICVLGALLVAGSMSTTREARYAMAAKSLQDFNAAAGQVSSNRITESHYELEQRKQRAEWLLIGGLVLCGLGIAVGIAAKKPTAF